MKSRLRLLVTSDWHLDATTAGIDRFEDVAASVDLTVERAISEQVDLYLFLGDLCDPDANRAPRCVGKAIEVARKLQLSGIASRWLVGNHDVIEDGSGTSTLTPLAASWGPTANGEPPMVRVIDRPCTELIGGVSFVWLPYVPRCASYEAGPFVRDVRVDIDRVVVAGHLSIRGQVPGSESGEMSRGRDLWLPTDVIATRWPSATVLQGHYHRSQSSPFGVLIPGALARLTFGEEDHEPGFLIVEVL